MKFANTVLGIISSRITRSPFYVRFQVTFRCNYRCRMCGQDHGNTQELSLEEIAVVAERLAGFGARHVVLTGGEPFLRRDLPEIIALFKKHNFSVRVQTNGGPQVTEELFSRCVRAGLQDISVSIDTLNPRLQDEICQGHKVTSHALKTLAMARRMLPDSISQANIVASAYNFTELPDLVRYFHRLGIYTYITPVMIGPQWTKVAEYRFRSSERDFIDTLGSQPYAAIIEELIDLRKAGHGLTNSTRHLRDYKSFLDTGLNPWRCEAGGLGLDVFPDGGVAICKEKPPFGNILDGNIGEIYRSRAFREQSAAIIDTCDGCFYGEYREPQYAIRHTDVLMEWIRDYLRVYRFGMRSNRFSTSDLVLLETGEEVKNTQHSRHNQGGGRKGVST